jgi:hypothetical protein
VNADQSHRHLSIKWGLSVLDWRDHAINESQDHPIGVFKAECGHLLMLVTALRETSAGQSARRAHSPSPGTPSERPRWREISTVDYRAHADEILPACSRPGAPSPPPPSVAAVFRSLDREHARKGSSSYGERSVLRPRRLNPR